MATRICLKRGGLGDVYRETDGESDRAVRDFTASRWQWLARRLAGREARTLSKLDGTPGVPRLIAIGRDRLVREFLQGDAMHLGPPPAAETFRAARRLLNRLHRQGVTHNDLAKEANWICRDGELTGIVDFQLSLCFRKRTRLFRLLAREDLRHLLKHKQHYRPDSLTERERRILATPLWPARWWRSLVKPGYRFVTRKLLGWPERDSAAERQRPA